jgi:hypothetical protein
MMRGSLLCLLVAAAAGAAACSSTPAPATGEATPVQQSRNPNVIGASELLSNAAGDLYSAIERLRPAFFQTRGNATFGNGAGTEELQVYVESMHRGGLATLREINAADVAEVRRLSAAEATQRFGTGHTMGAIVVTLKK